MTSAFDDLQSDKAIDLFCGAGGLTLGLQQAGYDVIAGIDTDEQALETYNHNFDHRGIQCDLVAIDPPQFHDTYEISPEDVDVLGGGPPCQAFSRAGSRDEDDPRANLVFRFATYVNYYQPRTFLMENVVGIQSHADGETFELLCEDLREAGYDLHCATLNAADYGVPQKRERVFLVGVDQEINDTFSFPEPTHGPPTEVRQNSEVAVADD